LDLDLEPGRVERCLHALAISLFDEVRIAYAKGCGQVWEAPCAIDGQSGRCLRHEPAWEAALESLSDSKLGPWDHETQRRVPDHLPPPYAQTLGDVAAEDLLVNHLRMPVICMAAAAAAECIAESAAELSSPLWDAHRRGLDHWWREGYDHGERVHHEPVTRVLIDLAIAGDRSPLEAHLRTFAGNANALHLLLDSLACVFTYDDGLRESLPAFWPVVMRTVLDAVDAGADMHGERGPWFDWAVAALLPAPHPHSWDPNIDGTLQRCRESWVHPEALGDLIDRWIALAAGEPNAADAIARLARNAPLSWQSTTGLTWLERIIEGRYADFSNRLWYVWDWLEDLRRSGVVTGSVVGQFHRIVDGLAAGGDWRAVQLQQLDE